MENPKVLILEDDLLFSVRMENALKGQGYAVVVVGSSAAALAAAEQRPTALVVLNYGKEAFAPLETTRALKSLPHPPAVLGYVSHGQIPELRLLSRQAGCDLLVANSVLRMRLPLLAEKLAPRDGSDADVAGAEPFAEEGEE